MILQRAKPEDQASVNVLAMQVHDLHVAWQPQYFVHMDQPYPDARFQKALEDSALYVAKTDGRIMGYVLVSVFETNGLGLVPGKSMRVEELCVAENFRHTGIGRQMMEDVRHLAKEAGCTDIRLTCAPENDAANRFYQSLGMEIKTIQYRMEV